MPTQRVSLAVIMVTLATTAFAGAGGTVVKTLEGHGGTVRPAFSPDGKLPATASDDRTVGLWDPATGKPLRCLAAHESGVWRVGFSPDGRTLASVGADRRVILWDVRSGEKQRVLQGHTDTVRAAVFSPDGKWLATGGNDETVRLWD